MREPITLGIETSCDETALAILEGDTTLRAHRLYSQIELHQKTGGVVPEIASRSHLEKIFPLLEELMAAAKIEKRDIDGVAATQTPGLVGCLLVGTTLGKAVAFALDKPFIGVNHIEGHFHAPFLEHSELRYPFLSLTVSGGHSAIYRVDGLGKYACLGHTVDDAAGEVLDKIARLLGLGYPGGPVIDRLAHLGNPKAYAWSRSQVKRGKVYMSFSGLKTAARKDAELSLFPNPEVTTFLQAPDRETRTATGALPQILLDFIASFQEAVVDELLAKLAVAHADYPSHPIAFSGGVSVNSRLRAKARNTLRVPLYFSSPKFCTDNAAMIAYLGHQYLKRGITSSFSDPVQAKGAL
jgi:N6-L-threonylcarbamoyladenine synthase